MVVIPDGRPGLRGVVAAPNCRLARLPLGSHLKPAVFSLEHRGPFLRILGFLGTRVFALKMIMGLGLSAPRGCTFFILVVDHVWDYCWIQQKVFNKRSNWVSSGGPPEKLFRTEIKEKFLLKPGIRARRRARMCQKPTGRESFFCRAN